MNSVPSAQSLPASDRVLTRDAVASSPFYEQAQAAVAFYMQEPSAHVAGLPRKELQRQTLLFQSVEAGTSDEQMAQVKHMVMMAYIAGVDPSANATEDARLNTRTALSRDIMTFRHNWLTTSDASDTQKLRLINQDKPFDNWPKTASVFMERYLSELTKCAYKDGVAHQGASVRAPD